MDLSYRWIEPGGDLTEPYDVRMEVFVHEQGFSIGIEIDDTDPVAHHLIVTDEQGPVATGRIFPEEGRPTTFHIGRVAVLKRRRGTGLGRNIMLAMEQKAMELGATHTLLGAQRQAQGFYERLGYQPVGEQYYEEHCAHIDMRKTLGSAQVRLL